MLGMGCPEGTSEWALEGREGVEGELALIFIRFMRAWLVGFEVSGWGEEEGMNWERSTCGGQGEGQGQGQVGKDGAGVV